MFRQNRLTRGSGSLWRLLVVGVSLTLGAVGLSACEEPEELAEIQVDDTPSPPAPVPEPEPTVLGFDYRFENEHDGELLPLHLTPVEEEALQHDSLAAERVAIDYLRMRIERARDVGSSFGIPGEGATEEEMADLTSLPQVPIKIFPDHEIMIIDLIEMAFDSGLHGGPFEMCVTDQFPEPQGDCLGTWFGESESTLAIKHDVSHAIFASPATLVITDGWLDLRIPEPGDIPLQSPSARPTSVTDELEDAEQMLGPVSPTAVSSEFGVTCDFDFDDSGEVRFFECWIDDTEFEPVNFLREPIACGADESFTLRALIDAELELTCSSGAPRGHRLLPGDSTSIEAVECEAGGRILDCAFPYGDGQMGFEIGPEGYVAYLAHGGDITYFSPVPYRELP